MAAAVLPLLTACKEEVRQQRTDPMVTVVAAHRGPLPFVINATGEVEPNRTVAVQSLVSGMLTSVQFTEGQEVREGQVLFQVDSRPFSAELARVRATLARDEAQLARARSDSARVSSLARDGYVTQQQLDQTFGEVNALAATVDADRASVERAELDLANTTIRAPINGRTGAMAIRAGNLVRAQADPPLVTINELSPVLVRFSVPETEFEEMRRRDGLDQALPVKITAGLRPDSASVTTGTLAFVNNTVDRATGSVLLKARVANRDRMLWPGQYVSVALELAIDQDAVTVPTQSIVTTPTGSFVLVVNESNIAERKPVRVGRTTGPLVKIDSGLVGGESVITEGQNKLTAGTKVQVRDGSAAVPTALSDEAPASPVPATQVPAEPAAPVTPAVTPTGGPR